MEGCDYSWARPGGAALAAAGIQFAMRYVGYAGAGGKELTPNELADLQANGISIGLIFEQTAGRILEGWRAGEEDARASLDFMDRYGWPADRPVYFACDVDARTPEQLAAVVDYLQGAGSVMGVERVGVYGGIVVIDHVAGTPGVASWYWQTYAWSDGQVSANAHILQYSNGEWGGQIDLCQSFHQDFGQTPVYTPVYQHVDPADLPEDQNSPPYTTIAIDITTGRPIGEEPP